MVESVLAKGTRPRVRTAGTPRLGYFRRRFGKWIALTAYGFPFCLGPHPTPVAHFRAVTRPTRFASSRLRIVGNIAMTLGWPIGAFSRALRVRAFMRERDQTPNGLGVLLDMYWLALRYSIPPLEYGLYRFNEPARRKDMHQYLYWNDLFGLAAVTAKRGADNRDVQDKSRFSEICGKHGLPHAPTLAAFDHGRQIYPTSPFIPDAPVLWTKSLRLSGGAGAAKWVRSDASYHDMQGRRIAADRLADEFVKQDCIVQPYLENHPDIARLSNGALAALRIVTGMDASGEAQFITSLIGLAYGLRTTSVAAILCSIEPETGRIRKAALPNGKSITDHPDTGAPIAGVVLPFWPESLDLARRAHATAFPRFAFLGWDIALTPDGPLLLETNSGWGALFHQMLDGPLGHTAFSRLISDYV